MNKALFLDRDGTINIDYGYIHRIEDFKFIDGIFELCSEAQKKGYKIIIITNQSGIEKGYYTEADYEVTTKYMVDAFADKGIEITDIYYCPFMNHEDRKPSPNMFLKAIKKHDIDAKQSISAGDRERDIEAAERAGVGKNFLFKGSYDEIMKAL
ncbi:MAG: HAD family hydrolase [Alphaproteobacteria bacterium]|nr:HAD family hydrolase [Alphaproteobacteria bacterium]MCL2505787.1 HAD family hydrolase [Alphaproteobacteria bacterium]